MNLEFDEEVRTEDINWGILRVLVTLGTVQMRARRLGRAARRVNSKPEAGTWRDLKGAPVSSRRRRRELQLLDAGTVQEEDKRELVALTARR